MIFIGSEFTWSNNLGTAEISELRLSAAISMPTALIVISHKTGQTKKFEFDSITKTHGKVIKWCYVCRDPLEPTLYINILND